MADIGGVDSTRLRNRIAGIEQLEQKRREIAEDIKDLYVIAKGEGFDPKIMRQIIRERLISKDDLSEKEILLDLYRKALVGWQSTPLGEFAETAE